MVVKSDFSWDTTNIIENYINSLFSNNIKNISAVEIIPIETINISSYHDENIQFKEYLTKKIIDNELNYFKPIVINGQNNSIIDGYNRYMAVLKSGLKYIPVQKIYFK